MLKVLERFINEYEIGWSEATTIAYKADIKLFLEAIAEKKKINDEIELIQSITNDDYEDWKNETKGVYALSTLNRKITALILFFKYVTINKKLCKVNPMEGVKLVKPSKKRVSPWSLRQQSNILTHEELLKLIEKSYTKLAGERNFELCSARDRFLISLEASTGVRIEEALNITFDMLDKVEGGYMVNIKDTKTGQRKRVPIANRCLKYYEEYIKERNKFESAKNCNYVIVSSKGNKMPPNKCNDNLKKLLQKAEITNKHITNHSNRHMFRTNATAKGVQESLIKIIAGWKLDPIADIYLEDTKGLDGAKIKACNLI
jgi:site-specific recombinase XerD